MSKTLVLITIKIYCAVKLYRLRGIQCCTQLKILSYIVKKIKACLLVVIFFFFLLILFSLLLFVPFENQEKYNFLYFTVIGKN